MNTVLLISLIAVGLVSFAIALLLIPSVIKIAHKKQLLDVPDHRKAHRSPIPTLGGIGIFAGIVASLLIAMIFSNFLEIKWVLIAIGILFIMGIWDDLKDLSAKQKFVVQFFVAFLVAANGIRIESLYGLLGIEVLPLWIQYAITVLFLVGVTNAVNLMDGIDGLAGGIVGMNALVFFVLFVSIGNVQWALVSISMVGALLGFLRYNFHPAKIFMGDTGSLVIGFLLAVLSIQYMKVGETKGAFSFVPAAVLVLLPVFDTLRVFLLRLLKGKSPFTPDRNHLHHLFLKLGFTHKKAALLMYTANALLIVVALFLYQEQVSVLMALILLLILAILLAELLSVKRRWEVDRRQRELRKSQENKQSNNYLLNKLGQQYGEV